MTKFDNKLRCFKKPKFHVAPKECPSWLVEFEYMVYIECITELRLFGNLPLFDEGWIVLVLKQIKVVTFSVVVSRDVQFVYSRFYEV